MAIGITQYVNRKLSITDNVNDRNLVIDVISNASDFVTPFTLFHPLYKMNALERNLLTAVGATDDIFECLARMDLNLTSGLEYNLLAALIEEYGLDYPAIVANLGYNVWNWDASDTSTLFQDSAGSTPVTANNDPVGRWVDRIQSVPATQGTTAAKPTFRTATLNGLATLSFDGGDLLATANISISTFAIWAVFRASTQSIVFEQSTNSTSVDGQYLFTGNSGSISVRRTTRISKSGVLLTNNAYRVVRMEHNGTFASLRYYANNALITTTGTGSDIGTGAATQPLFIGARSGILFPMTGNIAQLIIVSPYPTASIITNMESFVNGKWAVY